MCIPNTFLFEHVEARVNARRWDRTSVVLLVQGVERESSIQGAKPRLLMWGLQIRKWNEKEKWYEVIGGDYLQVCARNSIIKTAQILCLLLLPSQHVQYLKSPLSNTQPQMAIGWACLLTGEWYVWRHATARLIVSGVTGFWHVSWYNNTWRRYAPRPQWQDSEAGSLREASAQIVHFRNQVSIIFFTATNYTHI